LPSTRTNCATHIQFSASPGGERLAEGDDIRREDAHHRDAADEIEAGDPIGRGAERCCTRLRLVG
jgi:hypothetical protein